MRIILFIIILLQLGEALIDTFRVPLFFHISLSDPVTMDNFMDNFVSTFMNLILLLWIGFMFMDNFVGTFQMLSTC